MNSNRRGLTRANAIYQSLRSLPLLDEPYLSMQALNLDVVDGFIRFQEEALLSAYFEEERTPSNTIFVSALSQLWVFGLYELLRTWRQRAGDVLKWTETFNKCPQVERKALLAKKKLEISTRAAALSKAEVFHWPAYQKAAKERPFSMRLRNAVDRSERLFRRIEALRMSLAKHELPGTKGSFAMAPGYGRIDLSDGSIYWQVVLQGNEVDIVSRRRLADDCSSLKSLQRSRSILPPSVQEKIKNIPDMSYGVKRVAVTLEDGSTFSGVLIAWRKEILRVGEGRPIPFDVARIVSVRNDPLPDAQRG